MSIHTDAVPHSMGEIFIVRSVTCVGDHLACGGIHSLALHSGFSGSQGRGLSPLHDFEVLLHLVCWLAQDKGATDVRFISFDVASSVDQQNGLLADNLRLGGTVWQRRIVAHLHAGPSLEAKLRMCRLDELREVA